MSDNHWEGGYHQKLHDLEHIIDNEYTVFMAFIDRYNKMSSIHGQINPEVQPVMWQYTKYLMATASTHLKNLEEALERWEELTGNGTVNQ